MARGANVSSIAGFLIQYRIGGNGLSVRIHGHLRQRKLLLPTGAIAFQWFHPGGIGICARG